MKRFNLDGITPLFAMAAVVLFSWGLYSLVTYHLPLHNKAYQAAMHSKIADKPEIFYSAANDAYKEGNYELAKKLALLAFEELTKNDLKAVPAARAQFGATVLFLQGKALQRLDKKEAAIQAYSQSLRLDPLNKECKYNLEMLTMPPPPNYGGGGGSGQQNGGGQGNNGGKPDNGKPDDGNSGNNPSNGSGKPKPKI